MPTYYCVFLMHYLAEGNLFRSTRSMYLLVVCGWMQSLKMTGRVWSRPIEGTHKSRKVLYEYDTGIIVWTHPELEVIVQQGVTRARDEIISLGLHHLAWWADEHPNQK